MHARDLFGYACVLTDADRRMADDAVQAAFEAAAAVWGTLRDLPDGQSRDWLRDTLAAAIRRRTGHPADAASVSPAHRRLTQLKTARFRADYDAVAGLDRFADWLRTQGNVAQEARTHANSPPLTVFTPPRYPRMGGLAVHPESAQPPRRRVTVTR